MLRKTGLGLLIIGMVMQFIRPPRNVPPDTATQDISAVYTLPDEVSAFLKNKCYDCHSNHTRYPWYYHIQPIGWWMYRHIDERRKELNFSEFGSYPEKKALHKLEETAELVHEREMPLREYLWMHPEACVSEEEEKALLTWIESLGVKIPTPSGQNQQP